MRQINPLKTPPDPDHTTAEMTSCIMLYPQCPITETSCLVADCPPISVSTHPRQWQKQAYHSFCHHPRASFRLKVKHSYPTGCVHWPPPGSLAASSPHALFLVLYSYRSRYIESTSPCGPTLISSAPEFPWDKLKETVPQPFSQIIPLGGRTK